ncbi:MAG: RNA polymerase sigma factor [Deltaproteobacteria bacterium]
MKENKKTELFNHIIDEHKLILHKVSRAYCPDEDDRKDLIQEISLQIWRSIDKYNEEFKIATWIYRIALNVAISQFRKTSKLKTMPLSTEEHKLEQSETNDDEEKLHMLEHFINELNVLDKALILLYLEEKSHSEIAEILGISKSNTGTKISRIREKLKQRFYKINI